MRRTNGYTLIQLMIVVAILGIIATVLLNVFSMRMAGAHDIVPNPISAQLRADGHDFRWSPDGHTLTILRPTDQWASPSEACIQLRALDPSLKFLVVNLYTNTGSGEIRWEATGDGRKITNLPLSQTATC